MLNFRSAPLLSQLLATVQTSRLQVPSAGLNNSSFYAEQNKSSKKTVQVAIFVLH